MRAYMRDKGVAAERCDEIVLAVDEACTNAMRHSYGGQEDAEIILELHEIDRGLMIVLEDDGDAAPTEAMQPKPNDGAAPEDLKPGGLGVQLIHDIFDEVEFTSGEKRGNRVVMKVYPSEQH